MVRMSCDEQGKRLAERQHLLPRETTLLAVNKRQADV